MAEPCECTTCGERAADSCLCEAPVVGYAFGVSNPDSDGVPTNHSVRTTFRGVFAISSGVMLE